MNYQIPPQNLIIIGSSAGGPRILRSIFTGMPTLNSSIIIIQHMPRFINESLRDNIRAWTEMKVDLAKNDEPLEIGKIYIAPSELQIELFNNRKIHLFQGDKYNYVCPSVDVTMKSIVKAPSNNIIGVVLTGMGCDGAEGIRYIKEIGGTTIAQNEETSIIFGMPREAINTGKVDFILSPQEIHQKLIDLAGTFQQ